MPMKLSNCLLSTPGWLWSVFLSTLRGTLFEKTIGLFMVTLAHLALFSQADQDKMPRAPGLIRINILTIAGLVIAIFGFWAAYYKNHICLRLVSTPHVWRLIIDHTRVKL